MSEAEIQQSMIKAISRMSLVQQVKLLEFVNSMLSKPAAEEKKGILSYSGVLDDKAVREFEASLKDCQQIEQ